MCSGAAHSKREGRARASKTDRHHKTSGPSEQCSAVLRITWGGTLDTRGLLKSLTGALGFPIRMLRAANTPVRLPAPLASVQAVVKAGLARLILCPPPCEAYFHAVATAVVPAVFTPLLLLDVAVPLTRLPRGPLAGRASRFEGSPTRPQLKRPAREVHSGARS